MLRRKPGYRWVIFGLSFTNMIAEGGITDIVPVIYLAVRDYFRWSATAGETIVSGFATSAILVPWFPRIRGRMLGLVEVGNPTG